MGRAEKIASWTKENRFFVVAGVLIVLCVIVVVPIFAQSLNRPDGDYSTPALYLFSTIAQTMGAILGIVFAVFFAVYANMRSNPENPTIDYARSYLQSDRYFMSAALVGLFCILGSVVCLLMIYASGSLLNITVMLLLGILCLVLGLVSITLLLYFVTVRIPLYFEPIELYKEQRELLKKRSSISEKEYKRFLVDTLFISSADSNKYYLSEALLIIRCDYKNDVSKVRDYYNLLRELNIAFTSRICKYPKENQYRIRLNIIETIKEATKYDPNNPDKLNMPYNISYRHYAY